MDNEVQEMTIHDMERLAKIDSLKSEVSKLEVTLAAARDQIQFLETRVANADAILRTIALATSAHFGVTR